MGRLIEPDPPSNGTAEEAGRRAWRASWRERVLALTGGDQARAERVIRSLEAARSAPGGASRPVRPPQDGM